MSIKTIIINFLCLLSRSTWHLLIFFLTVRLLHLFIGFCVFLFSSSSFFLFLNELYGGLFPSPCRFFSSPFLGIQRVSSLHYNSSVINSLPNGLTDVSWPMNCHHHKIHRMNVKRPFITRNTLSAVCRRYD